MSKYEVLGVKTTAPLQEIKGAYQAAALATHPDKQASLATEELKAQVAASLVASLFVDTSVSPSRHEVHCRLSMVEYAVAFRHRRVHAFTIFAASAHLNVVFRYTEYIEYVQRVCVVAANLWPLFP